MQEKYLEQNLEKMKKYVEHDVLLNIYKNSQDNKDLKSNIEKKYDQLYKVAINEKSQYPQSAFVVPEGREIKTEYIDIVKSICDDLGINVKIDPTESVNKNDYVILTNLNSIVKGNNNDALCSTNIIEDFHNLPEHKFADIVFNKSANNVLLVQESTVAEEKLCSALISRFVVTYIPDAPLSKKTDTTISAIKEIREKSNSVNASQVKFNK